MNTVFFKQSGLFTIVLFTIFTGASAKADQWDTYNDPAIMDVSKNYEYNVNKLPMAAKLDVMPWSNTYWPTFQGSINYRWNSPSKSGFGYYTHPKEELMTMTIAQLSELSPAEKYDIFMGHYDYPLHQEVMSYGNPRAPEWNGMCDGWSMSALQFAEPAPVTKPNPDGILVPHAAISIQVHCM
jgi:hypothetical protein